jgi:Leu/Phe-tRNA-protein transferase
VTVFLLTDKIAFPPPHLACGEGLLAIGSDLSRERLLLAYRMGIFSWFSDDESMFTRISNASNVALVKFVEYLNALSFDVIDCQLTTEHLSRFGAREIPRIIFLKQLEVSLKASTKKWKWYFET